MSDVLKFIVLLLWLCINRLPLYEEIDTFGAFYDFYCVVSVCLFIMGNVYLSIGALAEWFIEMNDVVINFFSGFLFTHSEILLTHPLLT
jgi:hypothetical protein